MSRLLVGPFNRVEGDLDIALEVENNRVTSAKVNSTLYRGFEQILIGKRAIDALVYTPRICGICSISQSIACARALADLSNITITANGERSHNLLLANESLTDLLTHFYLFFMPDFARDIYREKSWYDATKKRFKAVEGEATKTVLPARAKFLHVMGVMAGRWPHTLCIQPGGSSKAISRHERLRLLATLADFRSFLENTLFGDNLDNINAIQSISDFEHWLNQEDYTQSDLRWFMHLSRDLELSTFGCTDSKLLSYGNFTEDNASLIKRGIWTPANGLQNLPLDKITEDISHSWMDGDAKKALHPTVGATDVSLQSSEKPDAYSWCKAPRLDGDVFETGALARAVISGNPLFNELIHSQGANVNTRVIARLLELAKIVPEMQRWATELDITEPYCNNRPMLADGQGVGLTEAARGSLGHWIEVKDNHISRYQIIAPTTWNFSPRDINNKPGALEKSLEGAPVQNGEKDPVSVQHIVRSFDPCMVCTVH
ncbi:nickel-dependent hydrogenase large subunit [Sessilibacter corallicola]|uniref:Nickel-dependent hydrogenase large subunit n=1 Tax=Sessilibacter corallicola TaxID=2904075 RepID=A0ABQ0ACQ0_9GAMM